MTLIIESVVLCLIFTLMVYLMSRDPIKTVYNYPPKIQERVMSLEEYRGKIPTNENKIVIKLFACVIFLAILAFVLKYVNGCDTFLKAFGYGFLLWTIVNLYDAIVLDIIWFCHDKHFVLKGAEDMTEEYHNYAFHLKGFLIGEGLALVICALAGLVVQFIL